MLIRIFGLIMIFIGFLILKYFPGISDYQKGEMVMLGIAIGIVISVAGIIMLIFG